MDIAYKKKKLMKCMKYLGKYPDIWEKLGVEDVFCPSTMEELDEYYDAWVEHYYGMDEKDQTHFSEYWFPLTKELRTCHAFVDLLAVGLPIVCVELSDSGRGTCMCSSLSRLVKVHKMRSRSRGKWI